LSESNPFPSNPVRHRPPQARGAQHSAKAEREQRVVEGLKGGVAMTEIARREGITVRGLRKYVRNLFARRAPEATGEFVAVQLNRLNEALLVSFDAMSVENLPAIDRVVKIVRELDRYHGLGGGAKGTEQRRKLLESLVSGANIDSSPVADEDCSDPLAEVDLDALLGDRLSPGRSAGGTGTPRNPLENLDSRAEAAPVAPPVAEGGSGKPPRPDDDRASGPEEFLAELVPPSPGPGEPGTEGRRKLWERLDSGAGLTLAASPFAEGGSGEEQAEDAAANGTLDLDEFLADLVPPSSATSWPGTEWRRNLLERLDSGAAAMGRASPLPGEGPAEPCVAADPR
jgi:DNA-binding CsgD family transcriptional regulator